MRAAILVLLVQCSVNAHHSFAAEYDTAKPVRLDGVIARFDFINPHAEIYLDVHGSRWWIEGASPQALSQRGITKSSVRSGMRVIIQGFQARDGSRRVKGCAIILPGGMKLLLDPSGASFPDAGVE